MDTKAKFLFFILKLIRAKKLATKTILSPKRAKKFSYPRRLKKYESQRFLVGRKHVITFQQAKKAKHHLVFLHGGALTVEMQSGHWRFVEELLEKLDCKVSVVDYPLAPGHHYQQTHAILNESYTRLVAKFPEDNFCLLGDSAGGGLCLRLAQQLRDSNVAKVPEKIALLSPWLDLSLSNPDIANLEEKDLLLSVKTLRKSAAWFADGLDLKSPLLSSVDGDLHNLKSIAVFVGTHEILLPDCRLLKQKTEKTNTLLFYREYAQMQHDFILFPIKEREKLLNDLLVYLKQ